MINQQNTTAQYQMYCSDIYGTTTPMSHVQERINYLKQPHIKEELSKEMDGTNIDEIIEKGQKAEKGTEEFDTYVKVLDLGSDVGYANGDLTLPLEDGVEETLNAIHNTGARITIYSSGAVKTSKLGMQTNGIDKLVKEYYSSSQKHIGSKYEAHAYRAIAAKEGVAISEMCYITDDAKEAEAAVEAGCGKVYLITKEAAEGKHKEGYHIIHNYRKIAEETIEENNEKQTADSEDGAEQAESSE